MYKEFREMNRIKVGDGEIGLTLVEKGPVVGEDGRR